MRIFISIAVSVAGMTAMSSSRADALMDATLGAARSELAREAQTRYPAVSEWSIEPLQQSLRQPLGALTAETELVVAKFGTRSAVRVTWAHAGSARQSHTLWFEVVGNQPVVVAGRDIKGGETLTPSDAQLQNRDVLAANCSVVESIGELERMRIKRSLRAGAAICREAIELRPPVARGDECIVRYESVRVSLQTKGVAQQDGQIGAKLRLMNPESKESFMAVVSGTREVVVYE